MKFYQRDIEVVVDSFLQSLEWIKTLEDIERLHGQSLPLIGSDHIEFSLRPSRHNTHAHTVSYVKPNSGIPLDVKLNPRLSYTEIILKMAERIPLYEPFGVDPFGNILQYREIPGIDVERMKLEIAGIKSH